MNEYKDMDKEKESDEKKVENNELAVCGKERDEYLAGWKRSMADYANREKEIAKEKTQMAEYVVTDILTQMIPVLDNLKSAFAQVPDDAKDTEWVKGIGFIIKQFEGELNNYEIRAFESVGQQFNPEKHEAVGEEDSKEVKSGIIIKEVEVGYVRKEHVIRPAKVIVAKNEKEKSTTNS